MKKLKMSSFFSIMIILGMFLCVPGFAGATSVVYDNTGASYGFWAGQIIGDGITLAGTDRFVTEFMFGYKLTLRSEQNPTSQTATVRFYNNDGIEGAPSTLLWQSESFSIDEGDHDVTLPVSFIEVPNTFIWTVQFNDYDDNIFNYSGKYRRPVVVGSSTDWIWGMYSSGWTKLYITDGETGDFLYAKVTAASSTNVPEPSVGLLLCLGLAAIVRGKRIFKKL
ncbi:MAG: PEP-CTERM sorting domain-containing protein [Sedimentisphaerales bacterium]|nr:PEP-CTERM sorting domain-containing protein [Sedimentisphaerales bacterium]